MGFIERTEKKFGKYAVSGLTMKLAVMQILFFLYYMLNLEYKGLRIGDKVITIPDYTQIEQAINKLNIGGTTIISDFIYILASPPLLPGNSFLTYIFMYFAMHLFILFGTSLEELWGKYKFNLYVLTAVIFALISTQVFKIAFPPESFSQLYPLGADLKPSIDPHFFTSAIYMAIFFSFATYFPKFELMLFFILPTPVRFLAYLGAGGIIFTMLDMSNFERFFWGLALFGTYFLFHYRLAVNKQIAKARKANFDKKVGKLDSQPFNKCKVCGRTEKDEGDLEFRIADDGEEYCLEHLDQAKK